MFIDAHSIPDGTVIESDICIVGGGAAGIAMAREFLSSRLRVTLLESGSMEFEPKTQQLYAGTSVGRPYPYLDTSRLRFFGGTTNHWGGWCLPFDSIDFEVRDGLPYRGWPFDRSYLDPWYRRTQPILQLGPYNYRPFDWGIRPAAIPAPFNGPTFVCKMLQNSPPTRFGTFYEPDLRKAEQVTVCLHANARRFEANDAGSEVSALSVATLDGKEFRVKARAYVLAAGGIENARLLLVSGKENGAGLGNEHDLVGRFFMVHLQYTGGTIALADPYTDLSFYTNITSNGILYAPFNQRFVTFVGLSDDIMRSRALPNIKIAWSFEFAPEMRAIDAVRRLTHGGWSDDIRGDLAIIMHDLGGTADFLWRKATSRPALPVLALNLDCTSEPMPNPESRIRLGDERDALGMRRVVVDWKLAAEDRDNADAIIRLLGTEVGRTGFGRLRTGFDGPTAWPPDMYGDEHHIGTTKMHKDPAQGVVDENCRLHGVGNLYVAGSSVFPVAGVANPTMTIVALALRLADRLKESLA
jgi:choline dehydrogenase-like flavoprotein